MSRSIRLKSLIACLLFCTSTSLAQQSKRFYFDEATGNYFSITMGIGNSLGALPAGTIAASIPYTSVDAQGHTTTDWLEKSSTQIRNNPVISKQLLILRIYWVREVTE